MPERSWQLAAQSESQHTRCCGLAKRGHLRHSLTVLSTPASPSPPRRSRHARSANSLALRDGEIGRSCALT